ncbi:MAG: hypothetical protein AB7I19_10640 [Planctomycetota bacterium]
MKSTRRNAALRKLLDLCDDLHRTRARLAEVAMPRETRARLVRQLRSKTDRLARDLANYRFKGPLGRLLRENKLTILHFQVLATLLQRHLRGDTPAMEGRELLSAVFQSSFEVLSGLELLHANGPLRASGLVLIEEDDEPAIDLLESRFRLSDDAMTAFRDEVMGVVVDDHRLAQGAYADNHEYLLDLRFLHNLYRHRAERVFQQERWDRVQPGVTQAGRQFTARIDAQWQRIERRLALTENAMMFPAVRFAHEHRLGRAETVVVIALLFRELHEGIAYADVAELIRLVSADERDLLDNRRLFLEHGKLLRQNIVEIDASLDGRSLTGEARLADWAVNFLFGAARSEDAIDADDRLDFHLYLQRLDDARTFLRDLEAN